MEGRRSGVLAERGTWWAPVLRLLLNGPGTALLVGLFFLQRLGFWGAGFVALIIQLPPNLAIHSFSSRSSRSVIDEDTETTADQHRQVEAIVTEIAARAGVQPPALRLTRSGPKNSAARIFERNLVINPGLYGSLSKQARRALIAHEIAHQYDTTSRERLVADLAIFIPVGLADAAIILTLLGRMPFSATLIASVAVSIFGKYVHAKLARINERQADLLATDILGEKDSMLALFRELSRRQPDPKKLGRRARLLRTHPDWQRRRLAVEKHKLRSHPRRVARLINRLAAVVPTLAFISVLAVLAYWVKQQT
jgi:Zn-dependent protease with chaperone function